MNLKEMVEQPKPVSQNALLRWSSRFEHRLLRGAISFDTNSASPLLGRHRPTRGAVNLESFL